MIWISAERPLAFTLSYPSRPRTCHASRWGCRGGIAAAVLWRERGSSCGEENPWSHSSTPSGSTWAKWARACCVFMVQQAGWVRLSSSLLCDTLHQGLRGQWWWHRVWLYLEMGCNRVPFLLRNLLFCVFSLCCSLLLLLISKKENQHVALYLQIQYLLGCFMLTCCASLAAAAASPVSTDATRAPSLTGRSCLGSVGVTRADIKEAVTKILSIVCYLV